MTRMKICSLTAAVARVAPRRAGSLATALAGLALLAGCAGDVGAQRAASPSGDARGLAAELDALQRQPGPASDEVIASLERALREQREKRARAVVAAGTTSVIPSGSSPGIAAPTVPLQPVAPATVPPSVVAAASAPAPAKPQRLARAQARAASAAAARQAAAARRSAPVVAPAPDVVATSNATPLPPMHPAAQAMAVPLVRPTGEAAVVGPERTPMSRIGESHLPVDELYARARQLELQAQVPDAVVLYREASQRGHAPSSQRLMELYADGAPGVARDYRVAVFFKERAVQQGASFDPVWRR
jgi:hypothetical protein